MFTFFSRVSCVLGINKDCTPGLAMPSRKNFSSSTLFKYEVKIEFSLRVTTVSSVLQLILRAQVPRLV